MPKEKKKTQRDKAVEETEAQTRKAVGEVKVGSHSGLEIGSKRLKVSRAKLSQEKGESTVTDGQARERKLDADIQKTFIGITVLDIVDPPFPDTKYEFGTWNERSTIHRAVVDLVRSFREDGKMPEKAPISIGVEKAWIDLTSTSKSEVPWRNIPRLRWTQAVDHAVVQFFGGRHRMKACEMWVSILEAERTTVEGKLDRLQKSGAHGVSDDDKTRMEELLSMLDAAIKDARLWVCRVYVLSELSNECQLHLSKNEVRPSRHATVDEKMFMSRLMLLNAMALWTQKNPLTTPPAHGTKTWREEVYNVAFSEAERRAPFMFMFINPHAFKVLGAICSFSYLRNGQTITLKTLTRALRPMSRASHAIPIPAAGFLWGWLIRRESEEMALIASAVSFPTLSLDVEGDGRVLELMRLLMQRDNLPAGATATQVYEDTKDLILRWTMRDNVRDVVWSGTTLEAVDEEYVKHFHQGPAFDHFGDDEAPAWADALQEYKVAISNVLKIMWTTKLQDASLVSTSESHSPDAIALENAYEKLQWAWKMRETGGVAGCDMPFITQSFLQDLLCRLEDCALGIEWLVRTMDGLCDSEIRLVDHPTFDYVSHLVYLLSRERLFVPGGLKEDKICAWLLNRLPLLAEVSVLLGEVTTQDMRAFYSITPNRWREKVVRGHVAVGHTPEDLPYDLRTLMPSFEWSTQDCEDVALAAQWIKHAWVADKTSEHDDALANRLCKSIAHLRPDTIETVPGLAMLYRTSRSWWDEEPRSVPEEAWMYAYQCVIGFKLWTQTSGRVLHHVSARTLRDELSEYLSGWAQPWCQDDCTRPSGGEWVFWDSLVFERVMSLGKELGLPACHVRGRGWVERQRQERQASHRKEVESVVETVQKLNSAKGPGGHLHPWVRSRLQDLCEALFDNADRIEVMEHQPSSRLYVPRKTPTAQFSIHTLDFGPEDEDDPDVFRTMEDFRSQDPLRYAEFQRRASRRTQRKITDVDSLRPQDVGWDEPLSESEPGSDSDDSQSSRSFHTQHTHVSADDPHEDSSNTSTGGSEHAHPGEHSDIDDEHEHALAIHNVDGRIMRQAHNSPVSQDHGTSCTQVYAGSVGQGSRASSQSQSIPAGKADDNARGQELQATLSSNISTTLQLASNNQLQNVTTTDTADEGGTKMASQETFQVAEQTSRLTECIPTPTTEHQMHERLEHDEPGVVDASETDRALQFTTKHKTDKLTSGETDGNASHAPGVLRPLGPGKPRLARARGRSRPLRIEPIPKTTCKSPTPPGASVTHGKNSNADEEQIAAFQEDIPRPTASSPKWQLSPQSRDTDALHALTVRVDLLRPSSPGVASPPVDLWDPVEPQTEKANDEDHAIAASPAGDLGTQKERNIKRVNSHRPGGHAASMHQGIGTSAMRPSPNIPPVKPIERTVNEHIKRRRQDADLPFSRPPDKRRKSQPATFDVLQFHDDPLPGSSKASQLNSSQPRKGKAIESSLKTSGFTEHERKAFQFL